MRVEIVSRLLALYAQLEGGEIFLFEAIQYQMLLPKMIMFTK